MQDGIRITRIYAKDTKKMDRVRLLLEQHHLKFEKTITETYGVFEHDRLIGTGSLFNNVIKMIAVDSTYQGSSIINMLMSHLIRRANENGQTHLFIFTSPHNYKRFEYFGFYLVEATETVALLENKSDGLKKYLKQLVKNSPPVTESAAIVVNCNPFTLGHRYLIETASKENKQVHVFVLWENLSTFPNDVRYRLVCEGVANLNNVTVHKAEQYMISAATFPSYFLGDQENVIKSHTELDVKIFGKYIAKVLNISTRYIGEEPLNQVTNQYNQALKEGLLNYGVEVKELKRIEHSGSVISASSVRKQIAEKCWNKLAEIVPQSTLNYLQSEEAESIINNIQQNFQSQRLV